MSASLGVRAPERRVRRALESIVPPIVFGIGFVVIWELTVKVFDLKPYFVPAPSAIAEAFADNIELVAKIGMPLLILFAALLAVRGLMIDPATDPGVATSPFEGLNFVWQPQYGELSNPKVWLAAAGQIFFTLSLGMGSIHVYASYLSEKDDVALSGLSTAATNETAEVVMGGTIAIPAAVAFFGVAATTQLAAGGAFNLGFVTLPVIFQQLPRGDLLGALWFFLLFIAGITSSLAMGQVVIAFLEDEFGLSRARAVTLLGAVLFVCTQPVVLFIEHTYMDELDFWAGTFGLFVFGAIELILFAWVFGIDRGWAEIQKGADIRIPRIFRFLLGWITPLVMVGIFLAWTWQNAPDVILMRGVNAANAPFVLGARLFMLAAFGVLLYLIRRAWRDHSRWEAALLDDLGGLGEHRLRDGQPKRLCGL